MRTLLLLCIAVFSFGFAQAQDCTGADHTVLAGNYYYVPSTLTVTAGETIAFQNEGGFHNVNGVSSTLGDTWSNPETFSLGANSGSAGGVCMGTITLNTPGTYQYDCSIGSHAANGMVGTIIVEEAPNTVQVTFNVNMANETTSSDGVFLAGGADFGVAGDNPMSDDDNDDIWTITKTLPVGYTGNYTFLNGNCPNWSCKENINGQDCADGPYADRLLSNITENTTVSTCFSQCTTDGTCETPSYQPVVTFQVDMSNAELMGTETIYVTGSMDGWCGPCTVMTDDNGDNIYTVDLALAPSQGYEFKYMINGWGGDENAILGTDCDFVPGDGFGNRGFDLGTTDTTLAVQCFNYCGTCEEQNAAVTYDLTFNVNTENITVGPNGMYLGGGVFGDAQAYAMSDDDGDGTYTVTVSVPEGTSGNYIFLNSPSSGGDWGAKENLAGQSCADPGNYDDRILPAVTGPATYSTCFGECSTDGTCGTAPESYAVTFQVDMSDYTGSYGAVNLNGGFAGWCGSCITMDDSDGDMVYTVTVDIAADTIEYKFTLDGWTAQEEFAGGESCTSTIDGFTNRSYIVAADATLPVVCYNSCDACDGDGGGGGPVASGPTDNAADPTLDAGGVVSVYGGAYDNIATNYNPFWGQSGSVTTDYDPGTGNLVLEYAAFNYQGTDLSASDLSGMTHLHVDVWVAADNARMLKVSPINGGSGTGEWLVEVPVTPGSWNSVDLPKSAFDGMTWDNVFQMKFDGQFNADGSANGDPWDVYLDNLYFWNDGTGSGPPSGGTYDVTFNVNTANITVGDNGMYVGGGSYFGDAQGNAMSDDDNDGVWTVTIAVPEGFSGNYTFLNSPADGGDWGAKEDISGQDCADADNYNDRSLGPINEDTTINTCFGQCSTDGTCGAPPSTSAITFQVDMSQYTDGYGTVNLNGSFAGWCGGCIAMDDSDGDMVYSVTVDIVPDTIEYKFTLDGWTAQEEFAGGESCTSTIDGFTNRSYIVDGDATLPVVCYNSCDACDNGGGGPTPSDSLAVSFSVDMNNYGGTFGFVNVSGTWNDFCGDCNQMNDDDLDGIWTATINLPPGENYRYKYQVDAWTDQEDLAPDNDPVGPCVVTEGGFTNRDLDVAGEDAITLDTVCWASCYACTGQDDTPGCNDDTASNYDAAATANDGSCIYDVTFSVNMNEYALADGDSVYVNANFNGWCGTCNPMSDDDVDGVWEVTIQLASDYYEYKFTVNGWTAEENLAGLTGCVTENFGFTNRTLQVFGNQSQPVVCWNSCSNCEGGGDILGCTDSNALNYAATATEDDGSCQYNVTFQVDMANESLASEDVVYVNGSFNGWCGGCNPMSDDDMDGVWTLTIPLTAGDHEHKFTINEWAVAEEFPVGAACDFNPADDFANRGFTVTGDLVLDVVCFNSCYSCDVSTGCTDTAAQNYDSDADVDDGSCAYLVTLQVDMTNQEVVAGTYVAGSFQGWNAGGTQMDNPGMSLYTITLQLGNGTHDYKFINGGDWAGEEGVPAECGADNGLGGFNRQVVVSGADITVDVVCFGECAACAGCTDPFSAEFSPFAGSDDGSCATPLVFGCTYADADNYNAAANSEDGSCEFSGVSSCPTDIDGDGASAVGDLLLILGAFGQTCE